MLDDGRLTDGQGHTVDFRQTVLIMTSNLGSQFILDPTESDEVVRERVMVAVREHFKPEFLNRLDDLLVFHRLGREQLRAIVDVQLDRVRERFAQRDLGLEVTDAAKGLARPTGATTPPTGRGRSSGCCAGSSRTGSRSRCWTAVSPRARP